MNKAERTARYFRGKVIWLTGASGGIGRALAKRLSEYGAKLVLSSRSEDDLQSVAAELRNGSAQLLPFDLADIDTLRNVAQNALEKFGRIDVLFNNAGVSQRGYLHEMSFAVIRRIMDVDFTGAAALTTQGEAVG